MTLTVLDSSAVLAVIFEEPGCEVVAAVPSAQRAISAVNIEEVRTKLFDRGMLPHQVHESVSRLRMRIESFTEADAFMASSLRNETREAGLSLGDRACIALGRRLEAVVMTADRVWKELSLPVQVEVIR